MSGAGRVAAPDAAIAGVHGGARIIDQGYRPYDGARAGLPGSMRSVVRYSIRSSLGLGRRARHKILPVVAFVIATVPALVFVGLLILIDFDPIEDQILVDYHEYYGWISRTLFFFCGIVVPDMLVADRRNGMLSLYFSAPLQRWSYLASKAVAVALTLAMLTVGPVLFLLVAYTLEGSGPDGPVDWVTTLVRILAAGFAISAAFTAASLAAASLTDSRAFAAIGVIVLLIGSGIVALLLVEVAEMDAVVYAFDIGGISDELTQRIHGLNRVPAASGEEFEFGQRQERRQLSTLFVVAANAAWVAAGAGIVWLRYRRFEMGR